jgi:acyl-CoA synthetase (AMP-forming)/AMP-acid ligase II
MTTLLHDLLFRSAELYPDGPALVFQNNITTYSALASSVRRFAGALRHANVGPRDRVGIFLDKRPEAVVALMGAAASGAVFVPINPALRPTQVAHIIADCGIKILVTSRHRIAEFGEALSACHTLARIVLVEDEEAPSNCGTVACGPMLKFIEAGAGEDVTPTRRADTEMVGILYTSGSTGEPKGVVLSHRNFVSRAKSVSECFNLTTNDRILNLPHYSFGFGLDQLFNAFMPGRARSCITM